MATKKQNVRTNRARSLRRAAAKNPAFVKFHPRDNRVGIPAAILQHPDTFVPHRQNDGLVVFWGLKPELDGDNDALVKRDTVQGLERQGIVAELYQDTVYPEKQFVDALIKKKETNLSRMDIGALCASDIVLKISLCDEPELKIWRRVRLSGGLSLEILADKVLSPLMGWARNYHIHLFIDYQDGSQFGPKETGSGDIKFLSVRGHDFIDEHNYKVAHLLQKPGDVAAWLYDFGDGWWHTIELESIVPVSESTGHIEIIDGAGACPAEDCRGLGYWIDYTKTLQHGCSRHKRETIEKIYQSANYRPVGWWKTFDPDHFDLNAAAIAVKDALSLPGSFRLGPKMFSVPMIPGGPGMQAFDPTRKKETKIRMELGGGVIMEESSTGKRDGVHANACSNCGTPHHLKLDEKCRAVYYCGAACQTAHWKARHKKECKTLAERGVDTPAKLEPTGGVICAEDTDKNRSVTLRKRFPLREDTQSVFPEWHKLLAVMWISLGVWFVFVRT